MAAAAHPSAAEPGTLYVVATPIGNLGDLSPRAREILASVDAVCAEDTRTTGHLLTLAGISRPLVSFHEHNERERVPELLERLQAGQALALCSDAGTPAVSDPGYRLVAAAAGAGLPVVAVPGPSAVLVALVASGLPTAHFRFEGFPPRRGAERQRRLETLARDDATLIFFESAQRTGELLADMAAVLGPGRRVVVARELTKKFEELVRGSAAELATRYAEEPPRGEVTVVVEGFVPTEATAEEAAAQADDLDAAIGRALEAGLSPRDVYQRAIAVKERSRPGRRGG
jgi:16S rRNA (cytidine1402-2'-O)-methyltransferase